MFYAVFSPLCINRVVESLIELIYSKFTFVEKSKQFLERTRLSTWRDRRKAVFHEIRRFCGSNESVLRLGFRFRFERVAAKA